MVCPLLPLQLQEMLPLETEGKQRLGEPPGCVGLWPSATGLFLSIGGNPWQCVSRQPRRHVGVGGAQSAPSNDACWPVPLANSLRLEPLASCPVSLLQCSSAHPAASN